MSLKIGIVGLPNVGKSTLFNALTKTKAAQAQNYPFCTIEPNVGIVEVPDNRLNALSKTSGSQKIIPAVIEFVDIAGLVKGASAGEGLGNKFLANIRECDAIGHVIRLFEDDNVTHVHDGVDPQFDKEVIESELLLADLQTLEKRVKKAQSEAKAGDKDKKAYAILIEMIQSKMLEGTMAHDIDLNDDELLAIRDLHLLTIKPTLYIVNVDEKNIATISKEEIAKKLEIKDTNKIIPICASVEAELCDFSEEESQEYLEEIGLKETGLNSLIRAAYKMLGLITYFTSGVKETRAWTINQGDLAPQAAGKIHTDFEKGFIKAEVITCDKYVINGGEQKSKENGDMKLQGKEYEVKDGDVIVFMTN